MKNIMLFEKYTKWYRGYTNNTKQLKYKWFSKDKNHAKQYSEINTLMYGGKTNIGEEYIDLESLNILDLLEFDMDDMSSESDIEYFIDNCTNCYIDYEYENLFDMMEDEIPLSRFVNKILDSILEEYDGFKINESEIETICLKYD